MTVKAARSAPWIIVLVTLTAMIVVVLMAPQEQSMGDGIRVVYVHVAWSGLACWAS